MLERFRRAGRRSDARHVPETRREVALAPGDVRGGVSAGAVLTGVVVAFGALFILSALITALLVALGLQEAEISRGEAVDVTIGTGIGLVVAQLLAYLWGGYTAGRMGRGAGLVNGLLVALIALLVAVVVAAIATSVGSSVDVDLPFRVDLPFTPQSLASDGTLREWGAGLAIAGLVAMFLGAILGGALGSRWHRKLERDHYEQAVATTEPTRPDAAESRRSERPEPGAAAATEPPTQRLQPGSGDRSGVGRRLRREEDANTASRTRATPARTGTSERPPPPAT